MCGVVKTSTCNTCHVYIEIAWKSELWIGSQPICGERTPTEEGQEIQCTDTVLRDDEQHIRYPEHQIQVRRNKDTEQVEPTSVYH